MSDKISRTINQITDYIYNLLQNNELHNSKYLDFIADEKQKKDYIRFLLLTLYSELQYFDRKRQDYKRYLDIKPTLKQDRKKMIKSLEYVSENIYDYISLISCETRNYNNEEIQNTLEKYQRQTDTLIRYLESNEAQKPSEVFIEITEGFLNFFTREIHKTSTIRNAILRYACLVTQICFGIEHKNKYALFHYILTEIMRENEDVIHTVEVKNLVKNIDINKELKNCFCGNIVLAMVLHENRDLFYKIDIIKSDFSPYYEDFTFNNIFFENFLLFYYRVNSL